MKIYEMFKTCYKQEEIINVLIVNLNLGPNKSGLKHDCAQTSL